MSDSMGVVKAGKTHEILGGADKFAASGAGVYVSPWTADSNSTDHVVTLQHGLNVIPQSVLVLFSVDQDTVYPINWPWDTRLSGNPVTVSMNATHITLSIFSGAPLHGFWNPAGGWTTFTNGYWKVIAQASA